MQAKFRRLHENTRHEKLKTQQITILDLAMAMEIFELDSDVVP